MISEGQGVYPPGPQEVVLYKFFDHKISHGLPLLVAILLDLA